VGWSNQYGAWSGKEQPTLYLQTPGFGILILSFSVMSHLVLDLKLPCHDEALFNQLQLQLSEKIGYVWDVGLDFNQLSIMRFIPCLTCPV